MKKLRTNEAAWLEKSGRWSIKVQRDGERKQFTSSKPGRKGKLEAERKADEWLEKGTVKEARFETAWANFLAAKRRECGSGWVDQLNSNGKTWLLPKLGLKKVSAITTQDWKDCILTAYEAGRNHKTLQNIRAAITGFVAYCEDAGIEIQPLRNLKVPNAPSNTRKILQPDELKTLFGQDTIRDHNKDKLCWYIYAWRLMVVTGLRRGELCGLRREDIDNGRLCVRRSVTQNCEITQGKTRAAQRTMVITDHAQKILDDQAAMLRAAGIVSPWLFPGGDGSMTDPKLMYKRWKVYRRQHGITVSLHELRHTHISLMQDAVPANALKRMVGHTKNMDTFGVYGHEVDGEAEKTAQIIDGVFNGLI